MAPKFSHQRTLVLIIDPQVSFCDPQKGTLFVPGADKDCDRTAAWIRLHTDHIDAVTVTLDSHHSHAIFFPEWHVGRSGEHPPIYTQVTLKDYMDGVWTTADPALRERTLFTLRGLEKTGRQQCTIWPRHCLIGGEGWNIDPAIFEALVHWELATRKLARKHTKGSNPFTEHYSPFAAEVPLADDPATQLNLDLISSFDEYDRIIVFGQAKSHCLAEAIRHLLQYLPSQEWSKLYLMEDGTSSVQGCEAQGDQIFKDAQAKGAIITSTTTSFN